VVQFSNEIWLTFRLTETIAGIRIRMAELERLVGELLLENKMLKKAKELDTIQKKDDSLIITSSNAKLFKDGAR
jgi:hypothetical protein